MKKIIKINNEKSLKVFKRNTWGNNYVVTVSLIGSGTDNGMIFNFAEDHFDQALAFAEQYKKEWLAAGGRPVGLSEKLFQISKNNFL